MPRPPRRRPGSRVLPGTFAGRDTAALLTSFRLLAKQPRRAQPPGLRADSLRWRGRDPYLSSRCLSRPERFRLGRGRTLREAHLVLREVERVRGRPAPRRLFAGYGFVAREAGLEHALAAREPGQLPLEIVRPRRRQDRLERRQRARR